MAASQELRLVAKIADAGDLRPVIDAGIYADKFEDQDARLIYEFILKYWKSRKTNGNVPTRALLEERFPTIELPRKDRLLLSSAIEEFQNFSVRARLNKLSEYVSTWLDTPEKVLPFIEREVGEMMRGRRTSKDIILTDTLAEAKRRYEESKNKSTLKGIPYPWRILNDETQGMQDGEFIIFYGRPKSLKTWVGLHIATYAYENANRRVMIYTREMSPEQMMDRCICLLIGAPYDAFRKGYLDQIEHPFGGTMEDAFYGLLRTMKKDEKGCISVKSGKEKTLIITSDREDRDHGGGVTGLRRKIEDHSPDLVFVDAVYLMRNDRNGTRSVKWSDQAAISQDLKEVAQDFKRPILATLQANRVSEDKRGESSSNMAFSDSYGQDCDMAVEIGKKFIDKQHNELALAITASREINMAGFAIHGNPGNDFDVLTRPAKDQHGADLRNPDGSAVEMPVIFNELRDVAKFFRGADDDENDKATNAGAQAVRDAMRASAEANVNKEKPKSKRKMKNAA